MEQISGKDYRLALHCGVVAIEKGAFGSPSTTVNQPTYYIYIYIYVSACLHESIYIYICVCVYV